MESLLHPLEGQKGETRREGEVKSERTALKGEGEHQRQIDSERKKG